MKRRQGTPWRRAGFTLIELLVMLAIMASLMTLVVPRYATQTDRAEEVVLRHTLMTMREAIDRFHADHGGYPASLEVLVECAYLRQLPVDPITQSSTSWAIVPPPAESSGIGAPVAGSA
ncbi:type II secretion system protein [Cupriavidus pauculus]|uniref:type II secretion system protein n=1 Tax=Cupriavidus pauculus TaxID=82633 RepID=UPI001EE33125|nr:prepilin-type N-terminal cleavage/methylation domain-containing protein [Cupriavidus pauculus]GJG98355.1 prepilin-type N-terminal cleavage/methylation domain-containing protein [Cupriavidus pauculus]